jgi:hypothetical protein
MDESAESQSSDKSPDNDRDDAAIYEAYVRQAFKRGLADSDAGRTKPVEEVRARYGLEP